MARGRWSMALAGAAAGACCAGPAGAMPAVAVSDGSDGAYRVDSVMEVRASTGAAWAVLTDYGRIAAFVPSVLKSEVLQRSEGRLIVAQEARAGFPPFRRLLHVLLRVIEDPPGRIDFEEVSGRDFSVYWGSWQIEGSGEGATVRYTLEARPVFAVPGIIARRQLRRHAQRQLEAVAAEMEREGGHSHGEP